MLDPELVSRQMVGNEDAVRYALHQEGTMRMHVCISGRMKDGGVLHWLASIFSQVLRESGHSLLGLLEQGNKIRSTNSVLDEISEKMTW